MNGMMVMRRERLRHTTLLVTVALMAAYGCGANDGLGQRYPVSGMVTYKGQPLASGNINFVSEKADGRSASGTVEAGRYTLTTQTDGDGAMPGMYKVTVVAKEATAVPLSKVGGAPSQQQSFKANKVAKSLIPNKYGSPTTTELKAEVKAETNKLDFDLTD